MLTFLKKNLGYTQKEILKSVFEGALVVVNSAIDCFRYLRYSGTLFSPRCKNKIRAILIKHYHVVEKALTLDSPRPEFGKPLIKRTIFLMELYKKRHGIDQFYIDSLSSVISYHRFNLEHGVNIDFVSDYIGENLSDEISRLVTQPTYTVSRSEILAHAAGGFELLVNARHSLRNFSEAPADRSKILAAAAMAIRTPSVCNRPTTRVLCYEKQEDRESILSLQNGNRGFGYKASHIALVVADINAFHGSSERYQPYIDGGLAAMSFVYALTSVGLATCFLNWSVNFRTDQLLMKKLDIPKNYKIITAIAIGNYPDEICVTRSDKIHLNEYFVEKR